MCPNHVTFCPISMSYAEMKAMTCGYAHALFKHGIYSIHISQKKENNVHARIICLTEKEKENVLQEQHCTEDWYGISRSGIKNI